MTAPATDFAPAPDAADARRAFERAETAPDPRTAADLFLQAVGHAEAAREWLLAGEAGERAADRLARPDPARAARLYQRAADAYDRCGQFAAGRRMAYRESGLKLWRGAELGVTRRVRVELFLSWLTSGFGLKPARVLGTAVAAWAGFALLYWLGGGVLDQDGQPLAAFGDALYLSGVTISTVGYGDVRPAAHLRFAAVAEGWIGLILFGYFVAVLTNRLRH
jgi:hypothetical protein